MLGNCLLDPTHCFFLLNSYLGHVHFIRPFILYDMPLALLCTGGFLDLQGCSWE